MTTPEELYVNGIKKHFHHFFAAWPPNEPRQLGDIGTLVGNIFVQIKDLESLNKNLIFKIRDNRNPTPIDLVSETGVTLVFKAMGELNQTLLPNVSQAEAGLSIEFKRKGGFILQAPITYMSSVQDIEHLGHQITQLYRQGQAWNPRWMVVVRLMSAPRASIVVSRSANSKLELSVSGNISTSTINLGNADLAFSVRSQSGDLFQSIGAQDVTPLFQLAGLKKRFWADPELEVMGKRRGLLPTDLITPENVMDDPSFEFGMISDRDVGL